MNDPRNDPRSDLRAYPDRPFLAVSAAIVRDGKILLVRRARAPANGLFSLPGGVVEAGETLHEAVRREIQEETSIMIEPVALAGFRDTVNRDKANLSELHLVIHPFAARWIEGEPNINEELSEARWVTPDVVEGLPTTPGLAAIVASAFELLK